jgi:hypothetical protein
MKSRRQAGVKELSSACWFSNLFRTARLAISLIITWVGGSASSNYVSLDSAPKNIGEKACCLHEKLPCLASRLVEEQPEMETQSQHEGASTGHAQIVGLYRMEYAVMPQRSRVTEWRAVVHAPLRPDYTDGGASRRKRSENSFQLLNKMPPLRIEPLQPRDITLMPLHQPKARNPTSSFQLGWTPKLCSSYRHG